MTDPISESLVDVAREFIEDHGAEGIYPCDFCGVREGHAPSCYVGRFARALAAAERIPEEVKPSDPIQISDVTGASATGGVTHPPTNTSDVPTPETKSEVGYQVPVEAFVQEMVERLRPYTLQDRIAQWRQLAAERQSAHDAAPHAGGALYVEGTIVTFHRCADEAELALRAALPAPSGWQDIATAPVGGVLVWYETMLGSRRVTEAWRGDCSLLDTSRHPVGRWTGQAGVASIGLVAIMGLLALWLSVLANLHVVVVASQSNEWQVVSGGEGFVVIGLPRNDATDFVEGSSRPCRINSSIVITSVAGPPSSIAAVHIFDEPQQQKLVRPVGQLVREANGWDEIGFQELPFSIHIDGVICPQDHIHRFGGFEVVGGGVRDRPDAETGLLNQQTNHPRWGVAAIDNGKRGLDVSRLRFANRTNAQAVSHLEPWRMMGDADIRTLREPSGLSSDPRSIGGSTCVECLEEQERNFERPDSSADPHQAVRVIRNAVRVLSNRPRGRGDIPLYGYILLVGFPGFFSGVGGWIYGRYGKRLLGISLGLVGLITWIGFVGVLLRGV